MKPRIVFRDLHTGGPYPDSQAIVFDETGKPIWLATARARNSWAISELRKAALAMYSALTGIPSGIGVMDIEDERTTKFPDLHRAILLSPHERNV